MKSETHRLILLQEYEQAPESAYFSQETVAAIRNCSRATVERDRWAGTGIPFVKMGRLVRYRKAEIAAWLEQQPAYQSTTQAQYQVKQSKQQQEVIHENT